MKLLGLINELNGFFNFEPLYELSDDNILHELGEYELKLLLQDSVKLNINLSFGQFDRDLVEDTFFHNELVGIEFDKSDLQNNLNSHGQMNQTGYKLNVVSLINSGKTFFMEDYGYYYVIPSKNIADDIFQNEVVQLDDEYVVQGQEILIAVDEDTFAGPYKVQVRSFDGECIINTKLQQNKYTLSGYEKSNCREYKMKSSVEYSADLVRVIGIVDSEKIVGIDAIDDETLMESFVATLSNLTTKEGFLDVTDIDAILDRYEKSHFKGINITKEIREARLRRINEILSAEISIDEAAESMAGLLSDRYLTLIEKYKDTEEVQEFIDRLVQEAPRLLDNMQSTKAGKEYIAKLEAEQETLFADIERLKDEKTNIENQEITVEKVITVEDEELKKENEFLREMLENCRSVEELEKDEERLQETVKYLSWHIDQLKDGARDLETKFTNKLEEYNQKMYDVAIDGFMASKIAEVASDWSQREVGAKYQKVMEQLSEVPVEDLEADELVDYICEMVRKVRPGYDDNTIINLGLCFTQGFLTVLSGKPGCGKTSICNIFAEILGLNKVRTYIEDNQIEASRYIPVSVERGWTSKRDLVGYYNPLTKVFDKNNKQIYDALQLVSIEKKDNACELPMYILLDEANLSPMEYYWADFMNVCDGITESSQINLGGENVFGIPETLHFMATINNDHTTENMSPRLIDRAWVITLPKNKFYYSTEQEIKDHVRIISWYSLDNAFNGVNLDETELTSLKQRYEKVIKHFETMNINISPRTSLAVLRYCGNGINLFREDSVGRSPETIALDYAISQKLLPKISGYGEEYLAWLENLEKICASESFIQSGQIVKDIIKRGNIEMKYYQFFN